MNPLNADDQLGKYRLVRELGAGGMGAVWLAHDTELDRKVALKVLRPALAGDDTAQARLLREARAMAKLRHPNVITVFDAESICGRDLVAMELVDGENMAGWLAHEHTVDDIAAALLAAGRGLAAAHAAGMIHRDFKPHNVLVERGGRVLVTDFGLARAEAGNDALVATVEATPAKPDKPTAEKPTAEPAKDLALEETAASSPGPAALEVTTTSPGRATSSSKGSLDSDLTRTGTLLGTPAYMAPEQIAGRPADARADQFAFCVTAWEAFAGKRPFPGDDVGAIAKAIHRGEPAHADKIPRGIRPLLERGLAADPAKRWPAMDPLLAAFERAVKRPKAIKQWSQAIGLGVFAFVAIFVVMNFVGHHKSTPSCDGASALASVYDKQKLAKLLADPKAMAQLDRWAQSWISAYDGNCKKPDGDDFSARTLCLEGERDQISLLVDPKAVHALVGADLAVMLPDPLACVNAPRVIGPPLPKDPALRAKEQDLRSLMIVLRGKLLVQGDVDKDVIAKANAAVAAVDGTDNPTVRADAMAVKSMIVALNARTDRDPRAMGEVYTLMKQAADLAEAAGQDRTRVQLQLGMAEMAVYLPGYWSDLDELVKQGEAGVEHTKDPIAVLLIAGIRAEVADKRGRWTEAIDGYEQVRRGWLARGSSETYARFTISMAGTLLNRHMAGDVDRALASLDDALAQDISPGTRRGAQFVRNAIAEAVGKADADVIAKLGYTRDAGAPNGGTLVATVSGLELPSLTDLADNAATRHGIPEVMVPGDKQGWRIAVGADGVFTLANIPPGTYGVEAFVNSAAGDLQIIRKEVTIAAHETTKVDLPYPALATITTTFETGPESPTWGISIALPGKPPANLDELQTRLKTSPWWTVATVHTVRQSGSVQAQATQATFGQATVCGIVHGYSNESDPSLFLGSTKTPLQCH